MPASAGKETRAQLPTAPPLSAGVRKAQAEWRTYRDGREGEERRSVLRGLILLALLVLVISLLRAGADRAFYRGWWQQW